MKWHESEVNKLKSLAHLTTNEIAKELGRTRDSVKQKLNALGVVVSKAKSGKQSSIDRSLLIEASKFWNEGDTIPQVAEKTGIDHGYLKTLMSQNRDLFAKRQTTKAWSFVEKPTPENTTVQYEYREIEIPEGALSKAFYCTEVGECSWVLQTFWEEPKYDSPCCAMPVMNLKAGGLKRTYCEYHYEASLEKQK